MAKVFVSIRRWFTGRMHGARASSHVLAALCTLCIPMGWQIAAWYPNQLPMALHTSAALLASGWHSPAIVAWNLRTGRSRMSSHRLQPRWHLPPHHEHRSECCTTRMRRYRAEPALLPPPAEQKGLLQQIDRMLQKALQATSREKTKQLTREICERGQRADILETRMEEDEGNLDTHAKTLGKLTEDNTMLQDKLEDLEKRSHRAKSSLPGSPRT